MLIMSSQATHHASRPATGCSVNDLKALLADMCSVALQGMDAGNKVSDTIPLESNATQELCKPEVGVYCGAK